MTLRQSISKMLSIVFVLAIGTAEAAEPGITAIESMKGMDIGVGFETAYWPSFDQTLREVFPKLPSDGEAVVFRDWSTVVSGSADQR